MRDSRRTAIRVPFWLAVVGLVLGGLGASVRAAPAQYNAVTGYGTRLSGGRPAQPPIEILYPGLDGPFFDPDSEISMDSIALASDVDEGDFRRLGFTVTFTNHGPGYYEEVDVEWEPVGEGWEGVRVVDTFGFMPDLVPGGSTSRPQPFEIRVPEAARDEAVADVLAGEHLRPAGIELHQFKLPAVAADAAMDAAFTDHTQDLFGETLHFTQSTPSLASLVPDSLIVESEYVYKLQHRGMNEVQDMLSDSVYDGPPTTKGLEDLSIGARVFHVSGVVVAQDGSVAVSGRSGAMMSFLDIGTLHQRPVDTINPPDPRFGAKLRDIYRPQFPNHVVSSSHVVETGTPPDFMRPPYPELNEAERLAPDLQGHYSSRFSFGAVHVPFNEIAIARGVRLDGEALLDAFNVELKVRFRGFLVPKISMKLSTKAELTMRLTAGARTSAFEAEQSICTIALPTIAFAIGPVPIEIAPLFKAKVGVTLDTPTNIVIPLQSSFEAGCVMTWDAGLPPGQQSSYRTFKKVHPLRVTDPLLNDSLELRAAAFLEAGVEVQVNRTVGPYFGARVTAAFELNPTETPWWKLGFDFRTFAEFRMSILGFNITSDGGFISVADRYAEQFPERPLTRSSGGPDGTPPGPFDPVSGSETRWARTAGVGSPGSVRLARVIGTDEDVYVISEELVVSPPILRLDGKGNIVWAKGASLVGPQRMAATADGGMVFSTGGQSSLVVWMDGNGNPVAARTFQPRDQAGFGQVFYPGAVLAAPTGETYVFGTIALPPVGNDVFVVKYDANHDLVFLKRYETPGTLENVTGAAFHPGGDLVVCGTSDGIPDTAQAPGFPETVGGGLLMRIQTDGDVVWALRSLGSLVYNSVTVSPEGTIFTAGRFLRGVTLDWPALLVARHDDERGDLEFMATFGEAMSTLGPNAAFGNPVIEGINDDYLEAGLTPYDEARRIEWTENGLFVCGNTANLPNVNTRAAVVMCLTDRLSVRWMTAHDGQGSDDEVFDLAATKQGVLTAGRTLSFGPNGNDPAPAYFMKLPLEGRLDFGPGGPQIFAHYLVPSVFQVPKYDIFYPGIATPPTGYIGRETFEISASTQNFFAESVAPPTFTDVAVAYSPPLQSDPRDQPETAFAHTDAVDFTRTTATLRGIVNPAGAGGKARFEWGTDSQALTNMTRQVRIKRTHDDVPISEVITGLATNTRYFYRARLDVGGTTVFGELLDFRPQNHRPVGIDDAFLCPVDAPVVLPVLANDGDADGDAIVITEFTALPLYATVTISPDGKSVIFDPGDGRTYPQSFAYRISDGTAQSTSIDVGIRIGLDRPPFAALSLLADTTSPVPDAAGATFAGFGTPALSDDGAVAATANWRTGRKSTTAVWFRDVGGQSLLLAQSGEEPPGLPGAVFRSFGDPAISPHGAAAFLAKVKGRGINTSSDDGLWTNLGGGLERVVTEGGTLPFLGTARVKRIAGFSIRDDEVLALIDLKPGSGVTRSNDSVLVRLSPDGNGSVVAREGSAVHAGDPDLVSAIGALQAATGSVGHGRFHGDRSIVARLTTRTTSRDVLVAFAPDDVGSTLLSTGTPAAEVGPGITWHGFGLPCGAPVGTAWAAQATLDGATASDDTAIVAGDTAGGPIVVVAREGGAATGPTATFDAFLDPVVNDDGDVAFHATLRGAGVTPTNDASLWSGAAGTAALVARTGALAPDTGGTLQQDVAFASFTTYALPGFGGGPAFVAELSGAGVSVASRTGLYAQTSAGLVIELVRTGDSHDTRTITAIALLGAVNGPAGVTRSFDAAGALVARLTYDDRSQALVRFDVP